MNAAADKPLMGIRVLVVEDDAILALDMVCCLQGAGAETLGPAGSLKRALAMSQEQPLSCGVFDVSLRDELAFPRRRRSGRGVRVSSSTRVMPPSTSLSASGPTLRF